MAFDFAPHLARFGPNAIGPPVTLAVARRYCARLAHTHYENFSVASLLLPRRLLPHFHAVYAWCRWADDLGDETGGGSHSLTLLRWWRTELDRMYTGTPTHPVTIALAPTVRQFAIPVGPFRDLLFAFEQDQLVTRYTTFDQLLSYCRHSADPVGRLVLYLGGAHTPENVRLSDAICTGLQLANFWQDVARDLHIGRVYLPAEDRKRFGYTDDDLHAGRYTLAFHDLMKFEVQRARDLFYRGMLLVDRVPADVRLDVELFVRGGLAILRKIEQASYDVLTARPTLSHWDKGTLIAGVLGRHFWGRLVA